MPNKKQPNAIRFHASSVEPSCTRHNPAVENRPAKKQQPPRMVKRPTDEMKRS